MSDAKRIEALISLPPSGRYEHFIKQAADREEVWGLYNEGWALAATDDRRQVFPVWPKKEFAELAAVDDWSGYTAKSIPLQEFMDVLLPQLKLDNITVGVFPIAKGQGSLPGIDKILEDLALELQKYE